MAAPHLSSHGSSRFGRPIAACAAVMGLALILCPSTGHSAQDTSQQRCINDMNRLGSRVAKVQGKVALLCLRDAASGDSSKLGIPPQEQTAQACLTNDVRGKVSRRAQEVVDFDADRCFPGTEQQPDFGYAGAAAVHAAAEASSRGIMEDLFDTDLDIAVVLEDEDNDGAKC